MEHERIIPASEVVTLLNSNLVRHAQVNGGALWEGDVCRTKSNRLYRIKALTIKDGLRQAAAVEVAK